MADAEYTFAQARARLEDIVGQVRKKDVSLETSLDLLEEGVRLANACTEHIDHTEWRSVAEELQGAHVGEGALDDAGVGDEDGVVVVGHAEPAHEPPDGPSVEPASEA